MDPIKEERYHEFMERFMGLQKMMRANQRRHVKCNPWLLVGIHSISNGKPVTISQISAKLEVSNAAVTQMIDNLEKNGLVERVDDVNDRRITLVRLTKTGTESLKTSFNETTAYLDGLFEHLGEEDTRHLNRLLDKLTEYTMAMYKGPEEKK